VVVVCNVLKQLTSKDRDKITVFSKLQCMLFLKVIAGGDAILYKMSYCKLTS